VHDDFGRTIIVPTGFHPYAASPSLRGCGCIDSIHDQVQDYLLKLDSVATHAWQAGVERGFQVHTARGRMAPDECQDLRHHRVEIERSQFQGRAAQEITQPLDDGRRPLVILPDRGQDCAHVLQRGLAGIDELLARLGVAEDGGERLGDLVCYGGTEFAGSRKPRRVSLPLERR
jgi:hypothetical protein